MDLKAISYNSTGFNAEKANFINFLVDTMDIDIFLLQEHMHLRANVYKIQRELSNLESFMIPAVKLNNVVWSGQPSGGLGIFWRKTLNSSVNIIKHPDSLRVQGIELCKKYIVINTYFPTDPQALNFNDFELLKCIEDVKWYINKYPGHKIIIAGDLNLDLSRNTRFVNIVRDFFIHYNLISVWSAFNIDFTFSNHQIRNGNNILTTSCIDHFIIHSNLLPDVSHAQAIHLGDNLSNHDPIYLSIKVESATINPSVDSCDDIPFSPHPSWNKASDEHISNYKRDLKLKLDSIVLTDGVLCNDPTCSDAVHLKELDEFCNYITGSIELSVHTNIPLSKNCTHDIVKPGWSVYVKPYRDDAKFWHAIWLSLGRPLNCEIHNVMKHTRNQYHYAVRKVKKNEAIIKQDNMLVSFLDGKVPNLIKQLKSQRSDFKSHVPSHMDGQVGNDNIANHFADKYCNLYNLNESLSDTNELLDSLNINHNNMADVNLVSPEIVYQAITCINANKSDNVYDFKSNAILNAVDILTDYITLMLQSFLIHGYVPNELLTCALKPIVKDNLGDKLCSDNYRAIGISSLILKVLDWVIFILYESELKPSDLQFGFQKKNSTTMCTWVVNETVNYFNNRNTPVFTCFLDLTKAFDLVTFSKLFNKLRNRIGSIFIRLMAYIYVFQSCCVEWCGVKSKTFKVSCGIRQGAVLSPVLFSWYIDDLFNELSQSGFGCHINDLYYGIVGYADDLVLLSPDSFGLQCMLDITKLFLDKLGLKISVNHVKPEKSKTKCMAFGVKHNPNPIMLNGDALIWSDSYKHLGHLLYRDGSLKLYVDLKSRSFIGQFFELRQELKVQYPIIYMNLILIYMSHFYGSNLWDLFSIDGIYTAWNKVVRNVFNFPYCTHRYLLEPLSEVTHLFTLLTNRFLKFYNTIYCSRKDIICNLRRCQERDCRSNFGINVRNICKYNDTLDIFNCTKNIVKYFPINEVDMWRVKILKELFDVKDNNLYLNGFTADEITSLIEELSCG